MGNWLLIQIQVTVVVVLLLLLRPGLHKLPKVYSYTLWGLVFVRLLCPIIPESSFGMFTPVQQWTISDSVQGGQINEIRTGTGADTPVQTGVGTPADINSQTPPGFPGTTQTDADSGLHGIETYDNQTKNKTGTDNLPDQNESSQNAFTEKISDTPHKNLNHVTKFFPVLVGIWLCGVLGILLYNIAVLVRIRRRLNSAICLRDNVYLSNEIDSPFVAGIARPRIYIPTDLSPEEQDYVLCHEQVHIKRKDYLIKSAAFLLTTLYWYNPFVWAAFHFMNEDMEMSCDEAVMEELGNSIKKQYSRSLLHFATGEKQISAAPLHFGENHVKKRVENVLSFKNLNTTAKRWIWVVGILAVLIVGVFLFTVRTQEDNNPTSQAEPSNKEIEDDSEPEPASSQAEQVPGENAAAKRQPQEVVRIDGDMDFSDALEELVTENAAYYATSEGIFRSTEEGIDRFYLGYPGPRPCMQIYENRLYFLVDLSYEQGSSLAFNKYNAIREVDLQTGDMGEQHTDNTQEISYFVVYDGYVTIFCKHDGASSEHIELIADKADVPVYEGSTLNELQPFQLQELGMQNTALILENPNVLHHIAYHTKNGSVTYLDLNGDGITEQIFLGADETHEGNSIRHEIMDHFVLNVETVSSQKDMDLKNSLSMEVKGFFPSLSNDLWALSLDGEHIYLLLYEAGPSGDPVTHFFTYEESQDFTMQASIRADIRNCEITADGVIHGSIRMWVIQTDSIFVQWARNEDGILTQIAQDTYDFTVPNEFEIELLEKLTVYDKPNGKPSGTFAPQNVHFLSVSGDFEWILMEGEDGAQGWFQIKDGTIVEPDKWADDVFSGLSHAG